MWRATARTSDSNTVYKPMPVDTLGKVAANNISVHHGNGERSTERDGGVGGGDGDGRSRSRFYEELMKMSTTSQQFWALTFFGQQLARCNISKAYELYD